MEEGGLGGVGVEGETGGDHVVVAPVGDGNRAAGQGRVGDRDAGGEIGVPRGVQTIQLEISCDMEVATNMPVAVTVDVAIGLEVSRAVPISTSVGAAAVAAAEAKFFKVSRVGAKGSGHGGVSCDGLPAFTRAGIPDCPTY